MNKCFFAAAVVLLPLALLAQKDSDQHSKVDIFGAYSYLRNAGNNYNGWEGQGTYWVTKHVGVTADLTREAGDTIADNNGFVIGARQHLLTYMFGPSVAARFRKNTVFAHALLGGANSGLDQGVGEGFHGMFTQGVNSANTFAFALGGGVDLSVTKHFAIRPVQIDYVHTNFSAEDALATGFANGAFVNGVKTQQNSFRYAAGVVFRF